MGKVVRVLLIENWHLWCRYSSYRSNMRNGMNKYAIHAAPVDPALPSALQTFPTRYGNLDEEVSEWYLFHGTPFANAVKVAMEGFDFRLSRLGFYGRGIYFASQACKSHKHA